MKFRIEKAVAFTLLATALTACSSDEKSTGELSDRVAVRVSAGVQTRAVNNLWEGGDAIGITMFGKGTATLAEGDCMNRKYQTEAGVTGAFKPSDEQQIIYFPRNGSEVDFMAYYPYNAEMKGDYKMSLTVADQSDTGKLDFMTAQHLSGTSKETPDVKLRFYHRLSRLIFRLKTEEGDRPERLNGAQIFIDGMATQASYNLLDGTLLPEASSVVPIPLATKERQAEALVFPRTAAKGVAFRIVLTDGSNYTAILSSTQSLDAGYKHIFNITLKRTPMTVTADIVDWMSGEEEHLFAHAIEVGTNDTDDYFQTGDRLELFVNTSSEANQSLGLYTYVKEENRWNGSQLNYWEELNGTGEVSFNAIDVVSLAPEGTGQLPDVLLAHTAALPRNSSITLPFAHAASQLIVKLKSPEGGYTESELAEATITLPGFFTGATFEKALYVPGTKKTDVRLSKLKKELAWRGCIQPQTIPASTPYITITLKGLSYHVSTKSDATQTFIANKKLTINVTLSKKELGGISATLTDWGLLPDINVGTDLEQ